MIVIFILIPLSILIATGFLAAFIWAVRSGQDEDTCTPALRMLWDESGARSRPPPPPSPSHPEKPPPTNKEAK